MPDILCRVVLPSGQPCGYVPPEAPEGEKNPVRWRIAELFRHQHSVHVVFAQEYEAALAYAAAKMEPPPSE